MADTDVNPLLFPFETDEEGGPRSAPDARSRFLGYFNTLWSRSATSPVVPPPPQIIHVASAPPSTHVVTTAPASTGCGCRTVTTIFIILLIVAMVSIGVAITANDGWAATQATMTSITSLLARYSAMQQHHRIAAYVDMYGDEPIGEDIRLETASAKSVGRVVGSVDLMSLRFDWDVHITDPHHEFSPRVTLALWVQRYDNATNLMRHVPSSPFVLCANISTTTPCAGHADKPPADLSRDDDNDPRLLSLAIYTNILTPNRTSEPLWLKAIS